MSYWDDIQTAWDAASKAVDETWQSAYAYALKEYEDFVRDNPEETAQQVALFRAELDASRVSLDAIKLKLPNPPQSAEDDGIIQRYDQLEVRYDEVAAQFYADVAPANQTQVGVIPLLVVGALAIGLGAATWSFAGYEYAVNLREQTALANKELDARIQASKQGRVLQESTLPAPTSKEMSTPAMVAVGLGVVGLGMLLLGRR